MKKKFIIIGVIVIACIVMINNVNSKIATAKEAPVCKSKELCDPGYNDVWVEGVVYCCFARSQRTGYKESTPPPLG